MRFFSRLILCCGVFLGLMSEARVFDMNAEKFAGYLKVGYQPTALKKTAFGPSSLNETYNGESKELGAGEFGFLYASRYLSLRFGIEIIRAPSLANVVATNAAGTATYYTMNSDVSVVIPKIGIEYNIRRWQNTQLYMVGNYGQGNLGVINSYTMTAAGTAATGKSDFTEDGRGSAMSLDGALALETLAFDTTTISLEVGYRTLKFASINHSRDSNTLAQGSVTKGSQMLNADGSARTLDFTGPFANLMFRFWVF